MHRQTKTKFHPSKRSKTWHAWLYLLPALVIYTAFMAVPVMLSLRTSLFAWNGLGKMEFVGFKNYVTLFTDPVYSVRLFNALKNNGIMFITIMILQNGLGLLFAVILTKKLKGTGFFRTIYFAPVTVSVVVVGFVWTLIYNPTWGVLNNILKNAGLGKFAIAWLGNEKTALICVTIAGAWQSMGLSIMMFVAAINAISEEIYETAQLDGCGDFKLFTKITLPLILPTVGMVTVLTFIGNFANSFDLIYAMQGAIAGPNFATDVMSTFFYRTAFGAYGSFSSDMGMGSAIAVIMFGVILCGVLIWFVLDAKNRKEGQS